MDMKQESLSKNAPQNEIVSTDQDPQQLFVLEIFRILW